MRLFVIFQLVSKKDLTDLISLRIYKKEKKEKEYQPIDIVYQPVKKYDEIIDCYFRDSIHKAYRTTMSQDKKKDKSTHSNSYQCFACNKFFFSKK